MSRADPFLAKPYQLQMDNRTASSSIDKEPDAVQVTKSTEGITTITINRSHRRNAIDGPTGRKLTDAFLEFENDDDQKVCVFYGANGTFCAGFDLHEVAKFGEHEAGEYTGPRIGQSERVEGRNIGPIGPSRMQIRKPVISAVSGYAVAGGLELSLLGDMRVAEEDAIFGVYSRRWGVPLIDGGTVRLQAIVGLGRAMDMILTGRGVGAQEALMMGLVNRIVPKGKALEEATKISLQLVKFPQGSMNSDRTSCYYAVYNASSFEDALRFEYDNGIKVISLESVEGAARFSAGAGRHGLIMTFGCSFSNMPCAPRSARPFVRLLISTSSSFKILRCANGQPTSAKFQRCSVTRPPSLTKSFLKRVYEDAAAAGSRKRNATEYINGRLERFERILAQHGLATEKMTQPVLRPVTTADAETAASTGRLILDGSNSRYINSNLWCDVENHGLGELVEVDIFGAAGDFSDMTPTFPQSRFHAGSWALPRTFWSIIHPPRTTRDSGRYMRRT
ncbi:hypothetical protein UA08_03265 [Talaromyces atroroseus]|uniref:Uncharacterized protein n=1 Tax=Talaromyces atroroseus TaxID=1441469 RepID=A0A225B2T6_TALAT|nr:hypothetical protein UA08_03265 [Talaromyces atroroseus]OKL61586.1 hypothetical protein UA08_03265 [Talaromyces atroroseus]